MTTDHDHDHDADPDRAGTGGPAVDWDRLRAAAVEAAAHAYAPYSRVRVGAAGLVDDGRIVTGCNVENASYGLTTCAENGVASQLAVTGGGRLVALAVVAGDGDYLAPCGRCRQVLHEFGGDDLVIETDRGPVRLGELLPGAFDADEARRRRDTDPPGAT